MSGSAELFMQHCQVPNLSRDEHLKALTEELQTETTIAVGTTKGKALLKLIRTHLDTLILPPTRGEQRVTDGQPPRQSGHYESTRPNGQEEPCTNVTYTSTTDKE